MNRLLLFVGRVRDRPIVERERHAAMAAIVVLLTATAILLSLSQPARLAARGAPHPKQTLLRTVHDGVLSHEAVLVAGRFLAGYLAYTHGHGTASQIRDATRSLIRSLQTSPLPVAPAERARHPRVLSLQPIAGRLQVAALVNDSGLVDYKLLVALERDRGRLLVSGLDGAQ